MSMRTDAFYRHTNGTNRPPPTALVTSCIRGATGN